MIPQSLCLHQCNCYHCHPENFKGSPGWQWRSHHKNNQPCFAAQSFEIGSTAILPGLLHVLQHRASYIRYFNQQNSLVKHSFFCYHCCRCSCLLHHWPCLVITPSASLLFVVTTKYDMYHYYSTTSTTVTVTLRTIATHGERQGADAVLLCRAMGVLVRYLRFCLTSEGQQAVLAAIISLVALEIFVDDTVALEVTPQSVL